MSYDPLDLAGQEHAKAQAAQRAKVQAENEVVDFKWLMGSKRGRRIVWRLLDQAGVFRSSFDPNAARMAFAEGNRNAGLAIIGQVLTHCPELYPTMVKEANERSTSPDDAGRNDQ